MSRQNLLNSICTLIFPCFNFTTESLIRPNSNSDLPPSVILEILLKLPIKTILRCRCVSKSWQNLISDPYFANIYLKTPPFTALALSRHHTITNPLDSERFFVVEIGENGDIVHIPFNPKALDVPRNGIFGIMGSCNGLLCLVESPHIETENHGNYVFNRDSIYNNQNIYVVNPLTGERTLLPEVEGAENIRDAVYGFGSSADGARCKVLRVVMRYIVVGLGHEIKVEGKIFTVGVDENWREYDDSTIPCYLFPCGVTLNGVLHFVGDNRRSGLIYAFDIEEEKGRCIPLPSRLGDEAGVIVLAKWNGHLCLTDNSNDRQVDIWTMREYGVEESWTRDIVVRSSIPSSLRLSPFIPVTTMRNGDLLMSCSYGESLVTFDPKTKNYTELVVSNVEGTVSFMFDFVPSFVTQNFSPS